MVASGLNSGVMTVMKNLLRVPTVLLLAATYALWALGTLIWEQNAVFAVLLTGVAIAQFLSLQHEALHDHPFANPLLNEALVFPALAVFVPYRRFRTTHLQHHHDPALTDRAFYDELLGTFAEHTVVHEASCIKIEKDVPLEKACLLGCGVVTGWGSAVYAADVAPGDTVVVVGVGGIGANAIQGARLAGAKRIVAIDPVEFKREKAMEFGATHTATSMAEALPLLQDLTWGTMANKVIMTMGVGDGQMIGEAMALAAKRGRVVVTNIHPAFEMGGANMSLLDLTLMEKQLVGSLFGSGNPRADIPKLLGLYREGQLDLDGLVTKTYKLEDINEGYQDMRDGKNIRGVLIY